MTGHDIVKQLRELKSTVGKQGTYARLADSSDDLLLSIAESFRPGDAERLKRITYRFQESAWGGEAYREEIVTLTRLQAVAEKMEEE